MTHTLAIELPENVYQKTMVLTQWGIDLSELIRESVERKWQEVAPLREQTVFSLYGLCAATDVTWDDFMAAKRTQHAAPLHFRMR